MICDLNCSFRKRTWQEQVAGIEHALSGWQPGQASLRVLGNLAKSLSYMIAGCLIAYILKAIT
jgi:hypothetical protein